MTIREGVFGFIAFICGAAAAFFGYFGARVVHEAVTYRGEGSLGHVGLYIAAGLFPFLALLFAAFTWLAWRARATPPPASND